MGFWHRRVSGSGASFRETFRNRKRSGSTEFFFAEIQNAFDPNSRLITTWQQLILVCILYELLVLPYMAAFHPHDAPSTARIDLVWLYICELVFCADIYVQLNTGYYEDGNVLRDTRKSRMKYLRSVGFVLDVLALPPLSLLPVPMHLSVVFLEFHKFIRLRRLPHLISNLDNIYARYFEPLKLVKVLGITMVVSHLVACGRFTFGFDAHHHDHWLPAVREHEQSGRAKYLMSLFWAFGLLTGLFEGELPHTNAEFAFTIFVALCGFSLFTYLCATFFMLSKCESGDSETSEARVNQFKHILAFHRVPGKLQEQAVEYLKRYYTQAEANDREAARLLCPSISNDIQIELIKDTVAQIPVFEGCDTHFINAVTSLLELISCPAHFVLFRTGDHGDAMYVVSSGVLHTVVNGVKVRELRKGSFFGEVAVFAKLPRSATMVTTTYCTLYRLSRFHAEKLLDGYPRYARLISQTLDKMLKKAQTTEEDKISELASAGVALIHRKKKSSLLQVVGLTTEQARWNRKTPLSRVKPANGSPLNSSGSAGSLTKGNSEHQIVPTETILSYPKSSEASKPIVISTLGASSKAGGSEGPMLSSLQVHRPSLKVHPQTTNLLPPPSIRTDLHMLTAGGSLFRESKRRLELLRDNFFRKGKVGASDDKPQDVIRGFYDQLAHIAPPPPPGKHWWARFLLPKCIDAESRFRMVWLLCLQLVLCYNWIVTPLQLAFPLLDDHILPIVVLNIGADVVQLADIYVNLNLSYSLNSEKIIEPVRSAERYFKSWSFFLDVCCVWPYAVFKPSHYSSAVIRLPRLLRVWRLKGHFAEVENFVHINSRKRLIFFGLILLMLYHVVACLHFSITHWEGFSPKEDAWIPSDDIYMRQINQSYFEDIHGHVHMANSPAVQRIRAMQYFRSLYYATNVLAALRRTMEPDSDRQYTAALVFMLSGFLITAIVVDNVQKRFTASAFEQKEFFATRTQIQLFLKRQNAPMPIHQRVNSFLDFWWSSHRGAIIQELLEDLPAAIKRDIVRSICTPAMESLALLRVEDAHRGSASDMIPDDTRLEMETIFLDNLRFILFGQGEIIYRLGDYAGGLYFVLEGRVSVMADGGMPHNVPLGGFFGTAALHLHDDKGNEVEGTLAIGYTEHATAVSGCIVVFVSREHLLAMENVFPSLSASLRVLEERLRNSNVARTSQLDQLRAGPLRTSLSLRRAVLGEEAESALTRGLKKIGVWKSQTCFDPDSKFVSIWEAWIFLGMTAQCVLVVYHTCFGAHVSDYSSVYVTADTFTILLESCFLIDMYLQFRLGYYEYGNKVMDIQMIKRHYLRSSHFLVDMVAIVPLFMLNWLSSHVRDRVELLNWNKLLRILKAPTLFKSLEGKYVKLTLELRLFKLVYYTFLMFHFFGCIWFDFAANSSGLHSVIGSSHMNGTSTYFGDNLWLPGEKFVGADRSFQYFGSIFWSFGLMSASSPGELPKTVAQCLFSVCTMTGGFFLFAYVIGNFLDVIELEDSENRDFVAKLSSLRQLLSHFKLPQDIADKFKTYFFFKRFHSITQEHVLERVLPPSLLIDIRMFQLHPMIIKVAFLAGMDDSVTRMLVSLFTQIMFVKDEYICRFGEEGGEMFFIFTGMLDILIPVSLLAGAAGASARSQPASATRSQKGGAGSSRNLQKVNEITAGSYFGEAALFTNAPRNAFVKAKTSCILYKLSRQSLELVFDRYPEWKKKVLRIVKIQQEQQRLTRLAAEVQEEGDGGVRRRGLKQTLSRMDALNSRAEGIEELLLASTRGGKKKSVTFSVHHLLLRSTLFPRFYERLTPIARGVREFLSLLVNGAEIQSTFYIFWLRLTTICTVFTAVFVPYRVVYDDLDRWNGIPVFLRVLECFCEFVYWWDIWFHFRVQANQAAMELYEQDHLLAYKRERLIWDLVAAFPIDHFVVDFVFSKQRVVFKRWLRLNRCLKVRNLVYYRNEIKRRSVTFELDKVKTLWLLYSLVMFWTSCAYFAVSMHDGFGTVWQAWLPAEELSAPDPEPDLLMLRLFRGLFFATTAFVKKGRTFVPNTTLDYAFSILICFVGQLIMALMIGEMANVFILYIDNEVQFRKNHITIEHYLARWKVSNPLKMRANAFLTSWWSSYAGVDYQTVFDDLPASVRAEGVLCIAEKPLLLFMERVFRPLTRGASKDESGSAMVDSLMHSIAHSLRFEGYPRGEDVLVEGTVGKAMYFVVRGYLFSKSVSNPSLYHAGRFRMGDYFGEKGLFGQSVSLMTVSTIRASDLFVLNSQDLLEVIKSHSYFQLVFKLAQDVVRQKKPLNEYFAEEPSVKKVEKNSRRRTSAPLVPHQLPSHHDATKRNTTDDADSGSFEVQLSKLLRVHNEREWDSAFRLFVELILPNGTLNDLDGKPKGTEHKDAHDNSVPEHPDKSFSARNWRAKSVVVGLSKTRQVIHSHEASNQAPSLDGGRFAQASSTESAAVLGPVPGADNGVGQPPIASAAQSTTPHQLRVLALAAGDCHHRLLQETDVVKEENEDELAEEKNEPEHRSS